ncbi:MAG: hypothetical protein IKC32_07015 [Clostridia bacterium]|nr:hypothetical protein [Clostridia bacterium]
MVKHIAKILHEYGAEVYVHCSDDEDKAKRVAKEIGNGLWVTGDLSKAQSVRRMFEKTGELDSVITVYVTRLFFRACTQAVTPP